MLNFSKRASTHFKCDFATLVKRDGDFWRIDVFRVSRLKYLICSHEPTLFTLILRAKGTNSGADIERSIKASCPWYNQPLSIGTTEDRRIVGSMTDMFKLLNHFGPDDSIDSMMNLINRTSFKYINRDSPNEALEKYKAR